MVGALFPGIFLPVGVHTVRTHARRNACFVVMTGNETGRLRGFLQVLCQWLRLSFHDSGVSGVRTIDPTLSRLHVTLV